MKVPTTPNPFQSRYNAPPPIVFSLGSFSRGQGLNRETRSRLLFLIHISDNKITLIATYYNTLQHCTIHYDTLQHTITHCSMLRHAATRRNTLQQTLQHTATRHNKQLLMGVVCCSTVQRVAELQQTTPIESNHLTATRCNTLQRTATFWTNNPISHERPESWRYFLTPTSHPPDESCHVRMSHVTYEWVMVYLNESCHAKNPHVIAHKCVEAPSWKPHTTL